MTKFVVSGYIGFDNFGDEAIAKVLVDKLKANSTKEFGIIDAGEENEITLISANPEKTSKMFGVKSCGKFDFVEAIKKSDVLISGGGSLLQDVTSLKSLFYYLAVILTALFYRKKVIIYSQGIGPINSKIGQILTSNILKKCQYISVRDKKSQELLKSWGIESKLVKDPIFDLDLPQKHQKGSVGIQLRSFPTLSDNFLKLLARQVLTSFSDKKFVILSFQDSMDLEVCEKFARILKKKGNNVEVEVLSKLSINDVFSRVSELEYMIGMRFHANVVAIKSGVKTLAINYDIKVKKLADEYNIPIIELNQSDFSKEFDELIA